MTTNSTLLGGLLEARILKSNLIHYFRGLCLALNDYWLMIVTNIKLNVLLITVDQVIHHAQTV